MKVEKIENKQNNENNENRVYVIGICGITRSGKSSTVRNLKKIYNIDDECCFCLDRFYNNVPKIYDSTLNEEIENWEDPRFLDYKKLYKELVTTIFKYNKICFKDKVKKIILIEGYILFYDELISNLCDVKIKIEVDYDTAKARRINTKNFHGNNADYYFQEYIIKSFETNK